MTKVYGRCGLLCSDQYSFRLAGIDLVGNDLAHGAVAFAALEFATVMSLHSLRAGRASLNGRADARTIDIVANTDDHANHLQ